MAKVFYGNQYVGSLTITGDKPQAIKVSRVRVLIRKGVRFYKRFITVSAIALGAFWLIYGGIQIGKSNIVVADAQVLIVESTSTPPVLKRIMECESHNKQYAKNGQININVNSDGTIDLGAMQINSVNFAEATKLGYDLTKESDNIAYGKYLYANRGTEPWYSSKHCWNK